MLYVVHLSVPLGDQRPDPILYGICFVNCVFLHFVLNT